MSSTKPNLSPAEFAEWSGLSVSTVRRRIKDGSIDSEQLGGFRKRIFIPMDAPQQSQSNHCPNGARDDCNESGGTNENTPQTENVPGPRPKWLTEN